MIRAALVLLTSAALFVATSAEALTILPDPSTDVTAMAQDGYDLYLAVSINGVSRDLVTTVRQEPDGTFAMAPDDLRSIGLLVPTPLVVLPDGRVALNHLPNVTCAFNEEQQSIDFSAPDAARLRFIVPASGPKAADAEATPAPRHGADFGALLNYDIYSGVTRQDSGTSSFDPLSGSFEARAFGPFGMLDQTFSVTGATHQTQRLNTVWSLSDPDAVRTYRAGDIVTGGLSWTRPTRLGGIQVQSDFALRSDIVTYPAPSLSGSAALPSSVDIFVNNANRYSGSVPAGPFDIVDVPVVTGAGTVKLVVRDATGKEVVTTSDYFAAQSLIKPGLWDYSAELGFARTHFGTDGDGYDGRLMASASIRTGVTNWLTWEGHAEGGGDLIDVGSGVVATLGRLGVGQFSVAASRTGEATGTQINGSLQLSFGPVSVGAQAQRSFGRFEDIASYTQPGVTDHSSPAPAAIYQFSLSIPTFFAGGQASVSYTQTEPAMGDPARILAVSYGQRLFAGTASASAYKNYANGNYGVMASLWMPVGKDMAAGGSVRHDNSGTTLTADIGHSARDRPGDVSWVARVNRDDQSDWSASANTKLPAAVVRGQLAHSSSATSAAVEISGSLVAADDEIFLSTPVNDAFAVVDVGAKGVPVLYQNHVVGFTGADGKMLVPGLSAYQKNRISIDPSKLPLNAVVEDTAMVTSPARGSGVILTFGQRVKGGTALVSFRDAAGKYLPLASTGKTSADAPDFVVGYDGAALLEGLGPHNSITISLPDDSSCVADVPFAAHGTDLVNISDVACRRQ
jgi:outer membrane usher protein